MPPLNLPPDVYAFQIDPSLVSWNVPPRQWMADHDKHWSGLAVSSVVFDGAGRMLLVQRAPHDSMPNLWEVPGGGADKEDDAAGGSILRAAARELWEETGLVVTRFTRLVAYRQTTAGGAATAATDDDDHLGYVFNNRTGTMTFCKFAFQAQVKSCTPVVLDPEEHQDYVWASEDEVRGERMVDGRAISITTAAQQAVLMEAFRLHRQEQTA